MSSAGRPIPDPERMGTDQKNSEKSSNEADAKQEKKEKNFLDELCEDLVKGIFSALVIAIQEAILYGFKILLTVGVLASILICA
jgi:hypothetical protein